jgi:hypothetical protein
MPGKTFIQLLAEFVSVWGRLSGPIIPPGTTYANCLPYSGFSAIFDQFASEQNLSGQALTDFQNQFTFPEMP